MVDVEGFERGRGGEVVVYGNPPLTPVLSASRKRHEGKQAKNNVGAVQVTYTNGFTISAGKIHVSHAYQSKRLKR
jgi:hypothetical protein